MGNRTGGRVWLAPAALVPADLYRVLVPIAYPARLYFWGVNPESSAISCLLYPKLERVS